MRGGKEKMSGKGDQDAGGGRIFSIFIHMLVCNRLKTDKRRTDMPREWFHLFSFLWFLFFSFLFFFFFQAKQEQKAEEKDQEEDDEDSF